MRRSIHDLAAWLTLVAFLLTGVAPAQQLVVCVEPDGTVAIEAVGQNACAPCGDADGSSDGAGSIGAECERCIDIPLPTRTGDPQAKPKALGIGGSSGIAALPIGSIAARILEPLRPPRVVRGGPPLTNRLASIQIVVLRV